MTTMSRQRTTAAPNGDIDLWLGLAEFSRAPALWSLLTLPNRATVAAVALDVLAPDPELEREAFAARVLEELGARHRNTSDAVDRLRLEGLVAQLTALSAPERRRDLGHDELDELRGRLRGLLAAATAYAIVNARVAAAQRGAPAR